MKRWTGMMLSMLMGSMLWSGCSQSAQTEVTQTSNELNTLDRLHAQMDGQPQYRRSMRKPVRERQARTRRALERECDRLLAQGQGNVTAEALTGETASTLSGDYRAALSNLKASSRTGNRRALRHSYREVRTAYAAMTDRP